MKIITFSKVFPKGHPMVGTPTEFANKILTGIKKHTIRAGARWKVGDWFVPRQWSAKPYASKQEIILPPMAAFRIHKIWKFESKDTGYEYEYFINNKKISYDILRTLAENDGFEDPLAFELWFPNDFTGQIICWDPSVNY